MKRTYNEFGLSKIKKEFPEIANSDIRIFYDTTDMDACNEMVYKIIKPFNDKFKRIIYLILKNEYHDNLYKREDSHVTAMKFIGGKSNNARIYCKEIYCKGKKVVMISPYFKKVEKNQDDPKIMAIINDIKQFEYEIE